MKKIFIRGISVILLAFALVACGGSDTTPAEDVIETFTIAMSYANAVPVNTAPSTGKGTATIILNETQKTVSVTGSYEDLSAPVDNAHIHGPAAKGLTGGVIVALMVTPDDDAETNAGTLSLEATTVTDDQITDMKAGMHYINVHTELNPSGEIRGQISNDAADTIVTYITELSSLNVFPAVTVASSGVGKSVATLNKTTSTAMLTGSYSGLTGPAMEAHIHLGAVGVPGLEVLDLFVIENPLAPGSGGFGFPATPVSESQIQLMEAGQFYINIETEANSDGEIRGQIQ